MLQQTAGAFSRVQGGFTVFLDLYETLAMYKAAVNRINGFRSALAQASDLDGDARPIAMVGGSATAWRSSRPHAGAAGRDGDRAGSRADAARRARARS